MTSADSRRNLPDILRETVGHLNQGRISEADATLSDVWPSVRTWPQAVMLLGVVRLRQHRYDEAESLLAGVLRQHPEQPVALYHFGALRAAQGLSDEAIIFYGRAIAARPDYPEAILALGSALRKAGKLNQAKQLYSQLVRERPQEVEALAGLGATLLDLQDFGQAGSVLARAERLPGQREISAEIAEGLGTIKMVQRRFAEALPYLERALVLSPDRGEAQRKRATVLEHLQLPQRAAAAYREILKKQPEDLKTHLLLNELIYREGPPGELLGSYTEAAKRVPASPILPAAMAEQLMLLDRAAEAADAYRRALRLEPGHLPAQIGLARALDKLGEEKAAREAFEKGLKRHPEEPSLKTAYAFHLLQKMDAAKARALAESAVRTAPSDQAALAVLGLSYRATQDAREDDLNDYERFIGVFDLEAPEGYADLMHFHRDLGAHLGQLHQRAGQFFSQTLRGGTRAGEGIFEFQEHTRDLLKDKIAEAVSRYIANMPPQPGHAFLGRREKDGFRFSGSWSSRMKGGGYHLNHIHDGWISSVYYVDVPDATNDTEGHQGWLKFGEPSVDLGFRDPVRRLVQPKPGRLVLFPSYMWHGTVPFQTDEVRTTIAFDAVPYRAG